MTNIEWTDATWNPVTGCSKVSPGCANCYAETMALTRLRGRPGYPGLPWTPENAPENVVLRPERLGIPLRWRAPRRVFVNSMSDLFHELVPYGFIAEVFASMLAAHQHVYQVLTKRPERMCEVLANPGFPHAVAKLMNTPLLAGHLPSGESGIGWPMRHVWLGTSIENDRHAFRADHLRETPAALRFVSAEPLLGPLPSLDLTGIDWLIVGGESGAGHRPIDPGWVRDLRDRATEAGVAFFFKQWGGRTPKAGGRALDGRTWDEYPA